MVDVEFKIISIGEIKEAEMVSDKYQISLITRVLPGVNGTTLINPKKKTIKRCIHVVYYSDYYQVELS